MSQDRYFWVIGGGQMQIPLIEVVCRLGMRSLVTDLNPTCVCSPLADRFFPLDIFDIAGHLALADTLQSEGIFICGVLAAGIDAPETMARIAQHLHLTGVNPEIAQLVHNKANFRQRLEALGYPVPRYVSFSSAQINELPALAESIGYPLIIKNTDSSGSRGTRIFRSPNIALMREVAQIAISVSRSGTALIESCWEGTEHTVETLFDIHGHFYPCFVTDRYFEKTEGYALETGLRHPSALPESMQDEMYAVAHSVANDLGVTVGAAKFDFMVTDDGPRIIEMTVRLSGGFDSQYLVPSATGKDVLKAAVLTAIGQEFDESLLVDTVQRVGVTGSIWPTPGRIGSISGVENALSLPGIEKIFFRCSPGDIVQPYIDCTRRVCFIIATGVDEKEAIFHLNQAREAISIHIEQVPQ
jgi:biotin carboxylase